MKKIISISLSIIMLLSALGCINVFATTEKYPPLETGNFYNKSQLEIYDFETAGINPEPILLADSYFIQVNTDERELELNNKTLENQMKVDYITGVDHKVTIDQLEINCFGELSDGGLLVFVKGPYAYVATPNYRVIGKYVYITSCSSNEIVIYKNGKFTRILDAYQSGDLSDDLLDEIAEILCFAKFVNPNPEPTTEPTISALGIYGDVNKDNTVNINDATDIQKAGLGMLAFDEVTTALADVNGDGRISIFDVTYIQKYVAQADYDTKIVGLPYYA